MESLRKVPPLDLSDIEIVESVRFFSKLNIRNRAFSRCSKLRSKQRFRLYHISWRENPLLHWCSKPINIQLPILSSNAFGQRQGHLVGSRRDKNNQPTIMASYLIVVFCAAIAVLHFLRQRHLTEIWTPEHSELKLRLPTTLWSLKKEWYCGAGFYFVGGDLY